MTEQTDAAEVAFVDQVLNAAVGSTITYANRSEARRMLLDYIAAREAAAEARGAQAVLADLHDRLGSAADSLYFLAQDADEDRRMAKREGVLLAKGYVFEGIAAARAAQVAPSRVPGESLLTGQRMGDFDPPPNVSE